MPIKGSKTTITAAKLLHEVARNVELFGEHKTHDLLINERKKNVHSTHINFVVDMVCTHLSVTPERIINDKGHYGKGAKQKVLATKFIAYYCCTFKAHGVTIMSIAQVLNRVRKTIKNLSKEMELNRQDRSKENSYNQKLFTEFDAKIKAYMKTAKKQPK